MKPIAFALEFRGEAVQLDPGRLWVEARAKGDIRGIGAGEALCRRDFELTDDGSLLEKGELSFGAGDAVTFTAQGRIRPSPDPHLRHGTSVLEVTGGRGRLAGTRGFLTSNFLLSDGGELIDHHQGLLFVPSADPTKR
jgi:hypothetical protein